LYLTCFLKIASMSLRFWSASVPGVRGFLLLKNTIEEKLEFTPAEEIIKGLNEQMKQLRREGSINRLRRRGVRDHLIQRN